MFFKQLISQVAKLSTYSVNIESSTLLNSSLSKEKMGIS